ncbi:MAG: zinc finger domain-containing protein, partial [Sulfurimicrobium sp.]
QAVLAQCQAVAPAQAFELKIIQTTGDKLTSATLAGGHLPKGLFTKELEAVRVSGAIGSSLQAEVEIQAGGKLFDLLRSLGDDLRFVLISSQARLVEAAEEKIVITPSPHQKCERCWHYRADVGKNAAHPTLCGRCESNLFGPGEARSHA